MEAGVPLTVPLAVLMRSAWPLAALSVTEKEPDVVATKESSTMEVPALLMVNTVLPPLLMLNVSAPFVDVSNVIKSLVPSVLVTDKVWMA